MAKFLIVEARFYAHLNDLLIAGARSALEAARHSVEVITVPGALENPGAIALAAKNSTGQVFQAGLQMRSDPQRLFLLPFIRSGALGRAVKARAQWHKKQSWRVASPNADREKAVNWRLDKALSPGLVGEIGIHAVDQAGWYFNMQPVAVTISCWPWPSERSHSVRARSKNFR